MSILVDRHLDILEASPARELGFSVYPAAEVETGGAGRGEPAFYLDRLHRAHIAVFPDRVIRCEPTIDMRCLRLQRTDVKRQHKLRKLADLGHSEKGRDGKNAERQL